MQDHRLVLYPSDSQAEVNMQDLFNVLLETGVVGEKHEWQGDTHFLPGEQFLERITFLGCSPYINLAPPEDNSLGSEYCHISLASNTPEAEFLGGNHVRIPRCPHCKAALENWQDGLQAPHELHCAECHEKLNLAALNWRRSAAFGRCAVHIWGIHDGEAVPSDILMAKLQGLTGSKWGYFYRQSR